MKKEMSLNEKLNFLVDMGFWIRLRDERIPGLTGRYMIAESYLESEVSDSGFYHIAGDDLFELIDLAVEKWG